MADLLRKITGTLAAGLVALVSGCATPAGVYERGADPLQRTEEPTAFGPIVRQEINTSFKKAEKIQYKWDGLHGLLDYWQTPEETEDRQAGDCEDKAFYIARELDFLGIPNRVVFGFGDNMPHFWNEYIEENGERFVFDSSTSGGTVYESKKSGLVFKRKYITFQINENYKIYSKYNPIFSIEGPYTRERLDEIKPYAYRRFAEEFSKEKILNPIKKVFGGRK